MKKFKIIFFLKSGSSGQQMAIIQASDSGVARKIFEQQNPGCRVSSVQEVK